MNDGNTFSYGELVEEGQRRLAAAGVEEAAVDAWLLFSYDKKVDRTWYLLNRTKAASRGGTGGVSETHCQTV